MSSSNRVRAVIELFCKILNDNNIDNIRAETVRQAKFNNDSATQPLWKLLSLVFKFCQTGSSVAQLHAADISDAEVTYIKTEMQKLGYLNLSLAQLPHDKSTGSRALLLALGWVIHTQKLFDKVISARSSPLQQDLMKFLNLEAPETSTKKFPCLSMDTRVLPLKEKVQYQLMMCGKLRLSLRRLYIVSQQLSHLRCTIGHSTEGVTLHADRTHLTPLEVHLLRYTDSLKKMFVELDKDNEQLQNLLDWKEKEHIFWEWMDSVLILHVQERNDPLTPGCNTEQVYLPLPLSLGKDITQARAKLRDYILQQEGNSDKLEQLLSRKKISRAEIDILTHDITKDISWLTEKLQSCGRDWNPHTESISRTEHVTGISAVDAATGSSSSSSYRPKSKFLMQSAQARRASRQADLLELAKNEILKLEISVDQLETELRQLQMKNMQTLNHVMRTNSTLICIPPRFCKQLYDNQ